MRGRYAIMSRNRRGLFHLSAAQSRNAENSPPFDRRDEDATQGIEVLPALPCSENHDRAASTRRKEASPMTQQERILARNEVNRRRITEFISLTPSKGGLYVCPVCGSGTGPNSTGALQLSKEGNHITCYARKCFGEKGEDTLGVLRKVWNCSETEVFKRIGIIKSDGKPAPIREAAPKKEPEPPAPRADFRDYLGKCHAALMASPDAQAYLTGRGFTAESLERFGLGYDAEKKAVVIPYGRDGHYYITRSIEGKAYRKPKTDEAGPEPLYNAACLYAGDASAVFVVESALCAMSIMQEGGAAVALNGTGSEKLLKQITEQPTQKTLVLCLDNDEAGKEAQRTFAEKLTAQGVPFVEYNVAGKYKDPNEHLQKDPASFAEAVKNGMNAPEAQKEAQRQERAYQFKARYSAAGRIHAFLDGIAESVNNPPQPTGFYTLDEILDGGLYAGYIILTGGTSVGKTAFCLQIADNVAAAGRDVLYFTLEMTAADLMARSISRLTLKNCGDAESNAKTARYITDGTKRAKYSPAEARLVAESTVEYADTIAPHIFFIEPRQRDKDFLSTDDVKDVLQEYTAGMEPGAQGPLVIVDYAQLLRPTEKDKGADAKQNMSNNATVLYHISKQYNVPLLAITSQPRSEYGQRDSMNAGKESGDLEYTAEYLFRLQFPKPTQKADRENVGSYEKKMKRVPVRTVELAIMKNRSGPTGDTVTFKYHAKFNHFEESGHALDDVD